MYASALISRRIASWCRSGAGGWALRYPPSRWRSQCSSSSRAGKSTRTRRPRGRRWSGSFRSCRAASPSGRGGGCLASKPSARTGSCLLARATGTTKRCAPGNCIGRVVMVKLTSCKRSLSRSAVVQASANIFPNALQQAQHEGEELPSCLDAAGARRGFNAVQVCALLHRIVPHHSKTMHTRDARVIARDPAAQRVLGDRVQSTGLREGSTSKRKARVQARCRWRRCAWCCA